MSKNKHALDRIAQMQRAQEEAAAKGDAIADSGLVEQLAHEDSGEPNLADIAEKLKARQAAEAVPTFNERTEKMTIYVDADVAEAFNSLCVNRGDKQRYVTQALREFTIKKAKELGL